MNEFVLVGVCGFVVVVFVCVFVVFCFVFILSPIPPRGWGAGKWLCVIWLPAAVKLQQAAKIKIP